MARIAVGHHQVPSRPPRRRRRIIRLMPITTGYMSSLVVTSSGHRYWVPAVDELDHEQRRDAGLRQRQQHVAEEAHRAPAPSDARPPRPARRARSRKNWREQEGGGGRGDQRHRQAGVGVQHAEVGDHLVGRPDTHLDRPASASTKIAQKHSSRSGKREVDDREADSSENGDLAESDHQRRDEADHHHAGPTGALEPAPSAGAGQRGRCSSRPVGGRASKRHRRPARSSCAVWVEATKVR